MLTTLVVRTVAVSMTIYLTNRVGVWGKTEETDRLLQQGLNPLTVLLRRVLPNEQMDMSMGELAREYYNQGIKGTFHIIRNIPNYSEDLADGAKDKCLDLVQKAKEMKYQDGFWWSTGKASKKMGNASADPAAAGDGPSRETLIIMEEPAAIDDLPGDGKVALKGRMK
ncbi:MICOS complex subunit MIC13 homolog QIL1 [Drosophila eugracilis]|uniref:MICOS complex subunit MIC13 homolog QIL1 n=1 Tax=Drosophila eugracilis TaxID=29029 RepID=UPI0007E7A014|nr:MICOS complex subunit MIC13 homolog QIL1 [Drosophila eugracilis]